MRAVKRLKAIAELINLPSGVVADIGADHGYLAKLLIEEKRAKKVLATDISSLSIEKTRNLSKRYNLEKQIECRVGDGLAVLKSGEVDLAVVAGMGGYEIIKILEKGSPKVDHYILQPAQNVIELRKYLVSHKFKITKDFIVKDKNKFYNTIEAKKSNRVQKLTPMEIEYGLTNFDLRSEDFRQYLLHDIETRKGILKEKKSVPLEERLARSEKILFKLYEGESHARNN